MTPEKHETILMIEPFYGGSHKELIDILKEHFCKVGKNVALYTLPAKKWHWRARTSALYFSEIIPENDSYKILFSSSVLNLTELVGLRSDLSRLLKIVYFHENQLVYPVQKHKDRDFQYGYNQILTTLTADIVLFNSNFNLNSFIQNINTFLKLQPDYRPKGLEERIKLKSKVIYFPLCTPKFIQHSPKTNTLHIIWPHRWEHDKNPELFFNVLFKLKENNFKFVVSVLGESFSEVPDIFDKAQTELVDFIINWGRLHSKDDYFKCLKSGHVVVSTADHEFFGVAVLEAVSCGCFPVLCNKLVYPEMYPSMCLYNTQEQLYKKLRMFCEKPYLTDVYLKEAGISIEKFHVKGIHHTEGLINLRNLVERLEASYYISNTIDNNMLLKCALLEAENQSLKRSIREMNIKVNHKSFINPLKSTQRNGRDKTRGINRTGESCTKQMTVRRSLSSNDGIKRCLTCPNPQIEVTKLKETIAGLEGELKEREKTITLLCDKYMYLKSNKIRMETELKKKIYRLEKLLNATHDILQEVQTDVETKIEKYLSKTKNMYEALFLQEKWRCNRLMYENVRLHYEIKRLEDSGDKTD